MIDSACAVIPNKVVEVRVVHNKLAEDVATAGTKKFIIEIHLMPHFYHVDMF